MKNIQTLFLAVIISISSNSWAYDIAGIKLGSSVEEAFDAFKKLKGSYKIINHKSSDGQLTGFVATTGVQRTDMSSQLSGYVADEIKVAKSEAESVWFIGRFQQFSKNERFDPKTLLSSISSKYGAESYFVNMYDPQWKSNANNIGPQSRFEMSWEYYPNGKLWTMATNKPSPCGNALHLAIMPVIGEVIGNPTSISSTCGTAINLKFTTDENGLVDSLIVLMGDFPKLYAVLISRDAKQEADKKKSIEALKANAPKPNL